MEILRFTNILRLDYRCTTEDVTIGGVTIPKDTTIVNLLTEVLKGSHWENANTFNPDRFLAGSRLCPTDERFIPFLMGRRVCPGRNLASKQLFLYFTRIIQLFDVKLEVEGVLPDETPVHGVITTPRPFKLGFCNRNTK